MTDLEALKARLHDDDDPWFDSRDRREAAAAIACSIEAGEYRNHG